MNTPEATNNAKEGPSRVNVGGLVLLVIEDPRALDLQLSLASDVHFVTLVTGEAALSAGRSVPRGRLVGHRGHLGELVASLVLSSGARELEVAQIVVASSTRPATPLRAGVHWLPTEDPDGFAKLLPDLEAMVGIVERPHALQYDAAVCVGGEREQEACGRCLPACPYGAVARGGSDPTRMVIDHLACEGCGACAAVCPTGAISSLDYSLEEFLGNAHDGLSTTSESAPWILAHCSEAGRRWVEQHGDLGAVTLELPCLRAISDAAILGAFAMGAAGFALVGCDDCGHGPREIFLETVERNRMLLHGLGLGSGQTQNDSLLRVFPVTEGQGEEVLRDLKSFADKLRPSPMPLLVDGLKEQHVRGLVNEALEVLEKRLAPTQTSISIPPGGPYARAQVNSSTCTVCGACATVCPPQAFQHVEDGDELRLQFSSRSCVACSLCEASCPEGAIRLNFELSLGPDAGRHLTVAQDEWARCTICDAPVFSAKALNVIESRLADGTAPAGLPAENMNTWLRTCHACRKQAMKDSF